MSAAKIPAKTFLWHDYETFGINPAFDRPVQFAAIRTDEQLQPVGEPITWFARPMDDSLPHPIACLVTGITPQRALREGGAECDFARQIHEQMMVPGTCSAGYNSLRFDDQVSRHLFFRNFFDPYEREYKNGNSRWDLIDLVRMCYALRPEGVVWPEREPGIPSFKLEDLTAANGIDHAGAHDALVDVQATIELACLIKKAQPRLFDWALGMRDKTIISGLLDTRKAEPVIHTSSRIPAARGCTTLVLPLATVPDRPKETIVVDLMTNPAALIELPVEDIRDRLFVPAQDLPEGVERIPLKTVASNKVPMLAPAATLRGVDQARIGLDEARCREHLAMLKEYREELRVKVMELFLPQHRDPSPDPDDTLYSGGFFSNRDRSTMNRLRGMSGSELADFSRQLDKPSEHFDDQRLPEMLFRYRARNFPDSLSVEDADSWENDRVARLNDDSVDGRLSIEGFNRELAQARQDLTKTALESGTRSNAESETSKVSSGQILDQVEAWVSGLMRK